MVTAMGTAKRIHRGPSCSCFTWTAQARVRASYREAQSASGWCSRSLLFWLGTDLALGRPVATWQEDPVECSRSAIERALACVAIVGLIAVLARFHARVV